MTSPDGPPRRLHLTGDRAGCQRQPANARPPRRHPSSLHRCHACGKPRMFPERVEPLGHQHYEVELRCPDCGHREQDVFSQALVNVLDEIYEEGVIAVRRTMLKLARSRMEDWVAGFAAALERDLITPTDF